MPSAVPTTTYISKDGAWFELGVDVTAEWNGNEPIVTFRSPELGYSGNAQLAFEQRDEHGAAYIPSPFALTLQAGGTDRAEWRVYNVDDDIGRPPRLIFPAVNRQDAYNRWDLWWPDVPPEPVRLELWAEVRPGVPEDPTFVLEDGIRWAVLWQETVRRNTNESTNQSVYLRHVQMETARSGWGVDHGGRITRTSDGGSTWRDVTPPGHGRCDGRLAPRQTEMFRGSEALVALTCDRTTAEGHWSEWPQQITVFKTNDGGDTWHEVTIDTGYRFAAPAALYAAGDHIWLLAKPRWPEHNPDGALWHSTDGGISWSVQPAPPGVHWPQQLQFIDTRHGYIANGVLLTTADGGASWHELMPHRLPHRDR